jgi:putative transposase
MVATLKQACPKMVYPKTIRVDHGSGFEAVQSTIYFPGHGSVGLPARSDPGLLPPSNPTNNAFIEAFNNKLRSEYLNARWFLSLQDA